VGDGSAAAKFPVEIEQRTRIIADEPGTSECISTLSREA
jgi:hypothetical protein